MIIKDKSDKYYYATITNENVIVASVIENYLIGRSFKVSQLSKETITIEPSFLDSEEKYKILCRTVPMHNSDTILVSPL